jgi:hypothetical protein
MSQQTLEILSDEQIAPSLLESTYPELIASVGSIDSGDLLAVEYSLDSGDSFDLEYSLDSEYLLEAENSLELENSLASKYSLDSGDSISFQEIEVDSLTGIPNNSTAYARGPRPKKTTDLLAPKLGIMKFSYNNLAEITATVQVQLSPLLKDYIEREFVDINLEASVWGMDGGHFGRNSHLFNFSDQLITGEGTFTFKTSVNSNVLDEDTGWLQGGPTDEIALKFTLKSSDPDLVKVNNTAWTNEVTGRY